MKGHAIEYSDGELFWIFDNHKRPRREAHAEFQYLWGRPDVSLVNFNSLCKRKGWLTGRTGCFAKGRTPENKGKKCAPGTGGRHPNARKSQFRKGNQPHNTKYLGHERVSQDGYVEVSIAEENPHTGFERRYVLKHRHLWEQANGPIPEGHFLKCLDGDKTNTDPSNWEALPRAVLPRLSGGRWHKPYHEYEPELRPVILNIAKLDHKARVLRKGESA